MARPTKYSKTFAQAICKLLKTGCTRTAAAEASGIDYDTFKRWTVDNAEFFGLVTRAEAEAEAMFTQVMAKHAIGTKEIESDWRAAESWLKRRRRIEWGDNISLRADKEAAGLLAELFPGDAGSSIVETAPGEATTDSDRAAQR